MSKPLRFYKMIVFDASDTLITIPASRAILRKYLADRGILKEEAHIGELFSESFRLFYYEKPIRGFEACTPESDRIFWANLYTYVLDKLGLREHWTEEVLHGVSHELYDVYTAPEHYELFEDVKESLAYLSDKGFRLGIVSNFAPTLTKILESKGILHYFEQVIVSTEVGLEKPDPAIFKLALELSGLKAEELLYIGDHELNDVWAPGQVGIDAVRIIRYDDHSGEGIRTLRELFD
jgi:putative hydrolase of the HAD superfamily